MKISPAALERRTGIWLLTYHARPQGRIPVGVKLSGDWKGWLLSAHVAGGGVGIGWVCRSRRRLA